MRNHRLAVLAATVLALGVAAPAAATPPAAPRADLSTAVHGVVAAGVPGIVAEAQDGRGTWRTSAGVARLRGHRKPAPGGEVRVGSVSKTFLAAIVLQLYGEGRFGLDDPIGDYLPGLLPYPQPITIRQLLQHTSGLPRDLAPKDSWSSLPEVDTERFVHFDPRQVVELATEQPLNFRPGSAWGYSNIDYTVLGLLVEHLTGRPLEHELAARITGPLGLRHTFMVRDFPFIPGKAAHGYEQLYPDPAGRTDVTTYDFSRYFGAGTIVSNTHDVNQFFEALLGGRLLRPAALAAMKHTVPARGPVETWPGVDYGLGLMRIPLDDVCPGADTAWGHAGDMPGYGTWSMHSADGKRNLTSTMTQDSTAPKRASAAHQLVFLTELCGHTPRAATAHTFSAGPR